MSPVIVSYCHKVHLILLEADEYPKPLRGGTWRFRWQGQLYRSSCQGCELCFESDTGHDKKSFGLPNYAIIPRPRPLYPQHGPNSSSWGGAHVLRDTYTLGCPNPRIHRSHQAKPNAGLSLPTHLTPHHFQHPSPPPGASHIPMENKESHAEILLEGTKSKVPSPFTQSYHPLSPYLLHSPLGPTPCILASSMLPPPSGPWRW